MGDPAGARLLNRSPLHISPLALQSLRALRRKRVEKRVSKNCDAVLGNLFQMSPQITFCAAARVAAALTLLLSTVCYPLPAAGQDRFARSDSDASFLHHIDLYDADNRKISPESGRPYSVVKTCGRCHDYETISHGWHFNAFMSPRLSDGLLAEKPVPAEEQLAVERSLAADPSEGDPVPANSDSSAADDVPFVRDGRQGEPWIWTDARTGTQLPLSYRSWPETYDPVDIGTTPFEMTEKFGGRIPGSGIGNPAKRVTATSRSPTDSLDAATDSARMPHPIAGPSAAR